MLTIMRVTAMTSASDDNISCAV